MRTALAATIILGISATAFAATVHVPGDAPTVQAGIDLADAGDTVLVACGTCFEHDIEMRSGIHLRSESGLPSCVTIDAEQQGRVLSCEAVDETASIVGFTLQNGDVTDQAIGGGIRFVDSSPTIASCIVTASYAGSGGGIYCGGSSPSIHDCSIIGNRAGGSGGGIRCSSNSDPQITRCVIAYNHGMDGGGLWIGSNASPAVFDCTFEGNVADFWGGAIGCQGATPSFHNCTLVGNEAGWSGGGFWCCYDTFVELENTIIAFSSGGEGIHCYVDPGHPSDASLICCDLFGNVDGEYGGSIEDQTGINGNISEDPRFCDIDEGDDRLF